MPDINELITDADTLSAVQKLIDQQVSDARDGVSSDNEGLLKKNKELLADLKRARGNQLPDGVSKEDLNALEEHRATLKAEEERIALEKGEFDKIKDNINQGWQSKLDAQAQELTDVQNTLNNYMAKDAIMKELSSNKLADSAELLMPHLLPKVATIKTDDGYQVKVVNNGTVAMTDKGEEMGIAHVLAELKANPSFAPAFGGVNNGGGAKGSGGTGDMANNPFKTKNYTEQAKMMNSDPKLAKAMASAAGVDYIG